MRTINVRVTDSEYRIVKAMLLEHLRTSLAAAQFAQGDQPRVQDLAVRVRKIVAAYEALRNGNGSKSFTMRMFGQSKAQTASGPRPTFYPVLSRGSKGPISA